MNNIDPKILVKSFFEKTITKVKTINDLFKSLKYEKTQ